MIILFSAPPHCEEEEHLREIVSETIKPPGSHNRVESNLTNNNRTSSTLYQTALQPTADQVNGLYNGHNNKNNHAILHNHNETNEATDQLPTYQSIFANSLTRQKHSHDSVTATVSPITKLENEKNIQNGGKIQQNNSRKSSSSSPFTPQ